MPRRKAVAKREILPDPLYNDYTVAKFINTLMRAGKKTIAERIMYTALYTLSQRLKKDKREVNSDEQSGGEESGGHITAIRADKLRSLEARSEKLALSFMLDVLRKALSNVAPTVEVKSRRLGGATYQVPVEVTVARGIALAMRWIVVAARARLEKTMALRLAAELYEAYFGRGAAIKMRDDIHRMANANKAFAAFRW